MPLPPQHGHPVRLVERERAGPHLGVEEAGGDDVDAGEVPPLAGEALSKVRHKGLGAVVDRLVGGDVDNVAAHARGDDEVSPPLALEDLAGGLGAVHDAVDCFHVQLGMSPLVGRGGGRGVGERVD